ncbi:hypothetical protein IVB18_05335 [Bradyrhizobium sp. 186]|uniref:hypothetical protein n=1 Tax=Bradyrhizobium sp. 186 TaxID=2782654 RepID=UPI002000D730|nr:hypothetical protein [Bradyrhizobium sp. 186]UPK31873.1 hypothetical protein IVB18_26465 [Bradyrhizobium sp. 186]UPK36773.1 hypothetical protein IVB18_05335 [Bradyrhizobium sp. 186]
MTTHDRYQHYGFGGDRPPIRNEAASFPAGDASNSIVSGPLPGMMVINAGDPLDVLPLPAREKVAVLQRRRAELVTLYRSHFEEEQALRIEIFKHEARIKELQKPRGEGGYNLDSDAPQVVAEQKKLDHKRADLDRVLAVKEARSLEGKRVGDLLRNIEVAIAARPAGTVGKMVEIEPPPFKGNIVDTIAGKQRRGRELLADLDRCRHAPRPAAVRKAAMIAQVEALAEQGRPDAASSIEHGEPIAWPLERFQCDIFNGAAPGAIAFGQLTDVVAFIAWLFKDQLIERLRAELDAVADDDAALSDQERREREAQILADLLALEREEVLLIERARSQGLPADFRPDCSVLALLSITWVAAPPPEPREGAGEAGIVRHVGS